MKIKKICFAGTILAIVLAMYFSGLPYLWLTRILLVISVVLSFISFTNFVHWREFVKVLLILYWLSYICFLSPKMIFYFRIPGYELTNLSILTFGLLIYILSASLILYLLISNLEKKDRKYLILLFLYSIPDFFITVMKVFPETVFALKHMAV